VIAFILCVASKLSIHGQSVRKAVVNDIQLVIFEVPYEMPDSGAQTYVMGTTTATLA
jgi:hypothetical protein